MQGAKRTRLIGRDTSSRLLRLRHIFARLIEAHHLAAQDDPSTSDRLGAEGDSMEAEVRAIARHVWASPIQGPTDVLERALIAHHMAAADRVAA